MCCGGVPTISRAYSAARGLGLELTRWSRDDEDGIRAMVVAVSLSLVDVCLLLDEGCDDTGDPPDVDVTISRGWSSPTNPGIGSTTTLLRKKSSKGKRSTGFRFNKDFIRPFISGLMSTSRGYLI